MRYVLYVLIAMSGLAALPNAAEAYWHGRPWGWGGYYHPGWGCGWRCAGPGPVWAPPPPAVAAGAVGVVAAPTVVEPAPVAAAPVVATPAVVAPPVTYTAVPPIGSVYPTLPAGCVLAPRREINFYQCPGYRVRPLYGHNGVFYRVVPE
jgi:hypothetical protein